MKKFLGTRLGVILLTMLACMVIFGGVAFAANYSKDVPTSGMVLKASPGLTLYSDAACTVEATTLTFPNVSAGNSVTLPTFYIKNTGNKDLSNIGASSTLIGTVGTVSATFGVNNLSTVSLTKTTSVEVHVTLSTLVDGVTTDTPLSFTTSFAGTYN